MVLLNLETLSDTELRYIARQESIEDCDTLDREDLIEEIREIYDEYQFTEDGSDRYKYVKGITDINSDFLQLPGVDPLPQAYNETAVHLVLRDYNWAYAFWSVSINKGRELEADKAKLKLRLEGKANSYEIEISLSDTNWNVELPWPSETYVLKLISSSSEGEQVLAVSNEIKLNPIYLAQHADELKDSKVASLLIQPMTSKDCSVISNKQVNEILTAAERAK